jgi:hypothetical protein
MNKRLNYRLTLIKPLLVPMILFIGFEVAAISWLSVDRVSSWRLVVALLPMVPGLWLALGTVRAYSRLDELERKNLQNGMVFSFVITLILMISLGFLKFGGYPQPDPTVIALVMVILLLIGKLWSGRMYR